MKNKKENFISSRKEIEQEDTLPSKEKQEYSELELIFEDSTIKNGIVRQ